MPIKYNRSRNTVTISADGGFLKSAISGFIRESGFLTEHLSTSEKTFLNLKLLEKCQEKIFKIKEAQYNQIIQNQEQTNQILSFIKAETIKQVSIQSLQGSQKFIHLNRQTPNAKSDCLISSWTAFVNLDITFKTKEAELLKQNKALHNKISQMEEKIKSLYPSKSGSGKKSEARLENKENTQFLSFENVQRIESRIREHKLLNKRLKEKIDKAENEKMKIKSLYQILIGKCQQKYGQQVVQRLCRMFEKDCEQISIAINEIN